MALTKTILCNLALAKIGNSRNQLADFDTDTGHIKDQCDLQYEPTLDELVRMHSWNCTKERVELTETIPLITDSNDITYTYNATENGKAQFSNGADDKRIRWNSTSSQWEYGTYIATVFTAVETNPSTENVPPQSGWSGSFSLVHTYDHGWSYDFILPTDCLRPLWLTPTSTTDRFAKPIMEWVVEGDRIKANIRPVYLLYIKRPDPTAMDSLFAQAFATLLASRLAVPVAGKQSIKTDLLTEFYQLIMPEARRVNSFEGHEAPVVDSEWLEATYTSSGGSNWPPISSTYTDGSGFGTFP